MTVFEWVYTVIGVVGDYDFLVALCACVLVVIAFTCALSMVLGIVFAIFKR